MSELRFYVKKKISSWQRAASFVISLRYGARLIHHEPAQAAARCESAPCAASIAPATSPERYFDAQAASAALCRARPNENVNFQGDRASTAHLRTACKLRAASSSVWPPDRKTTPGIAGGTVRMSVRTVKEATRSVCSTPPPPRDLPGVTIEHFSSAPSMTTPCMCMAANSAESTTSFARAAASAEWSPSMSTSGSTIGTSPSACEMAAYLASVFAMASTHCADGLTSPLSSSPPSTCRAALHFVNVHPAFFAALHRSGKPSSPDVTCSPGSPLVSGTSPLSTLHPG
mmetsp:Transcript_3736/g.8325  ORF Transcript_3736/g.8325 Transcript_3736/m.8325 type:complete len:287 (+) Transcript_3736:38-898(+)